MADNPHIADEAMDILTALEHHRAGRLAEAVQIYQQILQADPDHAQALHLMGNAASQLGDADAALALMSKASNLVPDNPAYLISLALAYRGKQQFEEALQCYARVLALEPHSASAYFGIGNTQQSQGRLEEAARSFLRALELKPDFIEARYNLANLEKSCGRYAEAIAHYRLAVAAQPDFAEAYHNLGGALYAVGKLDEALASYTQALPRNWPETHNNIGNILFDQRQFEQALSAYRQAIAAKPDYAEPHNNLGNALCKLERWQEAAEAFGVAIRILPTYAIAHLNLGDLLLARDEVDDAAQHYEQALAAVPGMVDAWFNLGIVRNRQNRQQAARHCFEQALLYRPDYADALYNMGTVHGELGLLAEAERCYRQVLALDAAHLNAHINLSAILMNDGRRAEAKQHLDFAYGRQNLLQKYVTGADKTVLVMLDAGRGNLNLTHLFNKKRNNLLDWMIEYATDDQAAVLPHYDLVFNAMGDADITGAVDAPLRRFLAVCRKPLLNHPDQVALTARNRLPDLLEGIDNLLISPVHRFTDGDDWDETIAAQLPLLVRPVHTQGGIGLVLLQTAQELAQYRQQQTGPVYVLHFIDYRSADGYFRKYRMIFIDRQPYPYHLAISQNWMVHYYTAQMESFAWKLDEEQAFLRDPAAALGEAGMRTIAAIGATLDLDYAGIDFSVMPDGRILVFEANPTMLVHPEPAQGPLAHKNVYVQCIFDAFEDVLKRRAGRDNSAV